MMSLRSVLCESSRRAWLEIKPRFLMLVFDVNEMPLSVGILLDSVVLNC